MALGEWLIGLLDSAGNATIFSIYGTVQLSVAIYFYFTLKDTTTGLTDKQKKELYMPQYAVD